jgi:hypothetical protein
VPIKLVFSQEALHLFRRAATPTITAILSKGNRKHVEDEDAHQDKAADKDKKKDNTLSKGSPS